MPANTFADTQTLSPLQSPPPPCPARTLRGQRGGKRKRSWGKTSRASIMLLSEASEWRSLSETNIRSELWFETRAQTRELQSPYATGHRAVSHQRLSDMAVGGHSLSVIGEEDDPGDPACAWCEDFHRRTKVLPCVHTFRFPDFAAAESDGSKAYKVG